MNVNILYDEIGKLSNEQITDKIESDILLLNLLILREYGQICKKTALNLIDLYF
jgi:hypothetical protein